MKGAASIHVKPCNVASAEAHNRRSAVYMSHINKGSIYIRQDLTCRNRSWSDGVSLSDRLKSIREKYTATTGQRMQEKATPIREGVAVLSPSVTMDDLRSLSAKIEETWGIRTVRIDIHEDEGHWEGEEWKPNRHAHLIFDWTDPETGKTRRLNKSDMSRLQDMTAECLGMPRGEEKKNTKRRHLEREEYIIQEKRKEVEELGKAIAKSEANLADLGDRVAAKEEEVKALEIRAEKAQASLAAAKSVVADAAKYRQSAIPLLSDYMMVAGLPPMPEVSDIRLWPSALRCEVGGQRQILQLDPVQQDIAEHIRKSQLTQQQQDRLARGFLRTGAAGKQLLAAAEKARRRLDQVRDPRQTDRRRR